MKTQEQITREIGDVLDAHPDLGSLQETPQRTGRGVYQPHTERESSGRIQRAKKGNKPGPRPIEKTYLKEVREEIGISAYELSKITNTDAGNISGIETNQVNISIKVLKEMCISMGVSADDILFGKEGLSDRVNEELSELRLFKFNIERVINGTYNRPNRAKSS